MKPISIQSKSFFVLSAIAVIGTMASVIVTRLNARNMETSQGTNTVSAITYSNKGTQTVQGIQEEPKPAVDTSQWKEYKDSLYNFSFKYNPAWKIKSTPQKDGWYKVEIDPGARYDNIRVYVSEKDFYVMDGLPAKEQKIGNHTILNVSDILYGIRGSKYYYTFDLGASLSLQPQFEAMVKSISLAY